jgi:hypothetical protein
MRSRLGGILGLLLLGAALLLAGCTTGPSSRGSEGRYFRAPEPQYYRGYEPEYSSPGSVPPYYYGNNPEYEHWFTAPGWMPEVGP